MKIKSTFLTLVVAIASFLASRETSCANIVGYVIVAFRPGLELVANPLNYWPYQSHSINNNANYIMPDVPDGTVFFRFDSTTQSYSEAATYYAGVGWYPASGNTNDAALVLNPGEAFFVRSLTRWTNTFVGEVQEGWLINPIPANFSFKSSILPQSGPLQTDLKFVGVSNDKIYCWSTNGQYFTVYTKFPPWAWSPSEPSINVAEGFIVHRDPAQATEANWWIRYFSSDDPFAMGEMAATDSGGAPLIRKVSITEGTVTLGVSNEGGQPYDVQFSGDGIIWITLSQNQTGPTWTGSCPGGLQGYYQVVKH